METADIKWLLDSRNVHMLQIALRKEEFEMDPHTVEEIVDYENWTKIFRGERGSIVTIESSRRNGYQIVTWTRPCEALIADVFGGFDLFIRARKTDSV